MSGEPDKTVGINNPEKNRVNFTGTNYIRTSKYTIISFLPLNLLEQFRRVANCYFLVTAVITTIRGVTPIVPATAALPLLFVLTVAACKDGYEDYQRHVQDDKANSTPCTVLRPGNPNPMTVRSQDVAVGDILFVKDNEEVVADALVLHSSLPDALVYIDTAMLDGETNLKSRRAARQMVTMTQFHLPADIVKVIGEVVIQKPEPSLVSWKGMATVNGESCPLGIEQYLYRGSIIKDTGIVMAIVVYVGLTTKMFLNLKKKSAKSSILDQKLNKLIGGIFTLQQMIMIGMCGGAVWHNDHSGNQHSWYLDEVLREKVGVELFFWRYLTFFVLMSNFIPISLFVTLELCKATQAVFMMWDINMYHVTPEGREQHCMPKT